MSIWDIVLSPSGRRFYEEIRIDPDAFLATDLGVRAATTLLDLPVAPRALIARAERWQPWRAYAVQHLWATGDHAINRMPPRAGATAGPQGDVR